MKDQIEIHLDKALKLAEKEAEKIARKILKENPELKEFVMGMGSWFFKVKEGNENIGYNDDIEFLEPFKKFMDKYDDVLGISGMLMRFTAKGKKITKW